MKMYQLNPNDYGDGFFVMAESKDEAIRNINASRDCGIDLSQYFIDGTLPKKYSIDEYEMNVVVRQENC